MPSPQSLIQLIELASNVTDAFTVALFVSDPDKRTLSLVGHHTLSLNLDEKVQIAFGDGPIGWVAENEKPYVEGFLQNDYSELKLYKKKEDLKDFLAVPVMTDKLLGVLVVDSKESYRFTARSQKIITSFADQMAGCLAWKEDLASGAKDVFFPYSELLQYSQSVASSLRPATMADNMIRIPPSILQCDAKAVVWLDDDKQVGKITRHEGWGQDMTSWAIQPGKGIVGSCIKNAIPILADNLKKHQGVLFCENEEIDHFETVLSVPIIFKGHLLAVLVCASKKNDGLTGIHLQRMNMTANMLAPALFYAREKRQWNYDKNLDQIAKIPNHRCLVEHREKIEKEIFNGSDPVFFMSVHLKNLNGIYETHGVSLGDRLLRRIVSMLTKVVPSPKFLFKYSDTTILILAMKTQHAEIEILETKLKRVFEKIPFHVDQQSLLVEAELGLSTYPKEGINLGELACLSWNRAFQPLRVTHDH